ncbi:HAMP domain-containing histidine kinase [Clostridium sporogenes]|uniref:sensor histidine kinase n=1 Tax=Clostridium sporogenes TaxID=1509 RepID=UPI0013D0BDD4|nr:HAMP domain-containing sensor histidine kinase [Clostridium sporogenes]EKS4343815.1 HAMP domain-containing histidine kinase [Clostridium botulinum]EKS4396297.1 HAMP domain-containing histidine kinase [Clostridium botulinum]NFG97426.1 HAMP domain-containing histidine kinase [Clostridium sporogenes]NFH32659.1 HAMP domain-containing histidine kinase [Clostridium sporogenes]NFL20042.1 HAMP domain-containing histidine kinase [Clostridium sporogenes]
MKIRYKFITGLIFILIVSMVIMNVAITNVLNSNMENGINNFLKQVMNSTHEYVKYTLVTNSTKDKKEALVEEGNYIIKHISLNYECKCDIRDINYKLIEGNVPEEFRSITKKSKEIVMDGKAVVDLKYKNNGVDAMLTYPIYIDNKYMGIVSIVKNYDTEYRNYKNTINIINIIELGTFIVIFIFLFLRTNKITEPITELTDAIKKLGYGDYDIYIAEHGKDEVAILAREFINMRDKIKEQIETIESEKNKVYKLEKGRKEFFNSVTHELKTPLTAISGYAELLLTGMVQDEEFDKRAIERIYSESDRLHNLVLELIDVSKGMCVIEEELKYIDIKELIIQCCNDMNIKANKYSLKIIQNINEGTVKAQQDKIRQVLINIIDNAIKYSHGGNEIYVNSYILDNKYVVEVINNSNPIPDEIFNNIFEPFIKSNNDNKDSRGLGLYLCNEIIKEHNGEITIENGSLIKVKITLII